MSKTCFRVAPLGLAAVLTACTQGVAYQDAFVLDALYLPRAHSHNDYAQSFPLSEALFRGFASIEVDVVLRDGELYVAHAPEEVDERHTLRGQYLDPLRDMVERTGSVHGPHRPPLQLLIDVKTDADESYALLHEILQPYSPMLTSWEAGRRVPGAISVVISGNRPSVGRMEADRVRYAALDGRILDDRRGVGPDLMPLVSADWEGLGPPIPEERLERAGRVIEQMHAEGRKVRFWATPEDEELWTSLLSLGVDYIGTDDPKRLGLHMRERDDPTAARID